MCKCFAWKKNRKKLKNDPFLEKPFSRGKKAVFSATKNRAQGGPLPRY